MAGYKRTIPHFETGNYKSPGVFLADAEYGRALDCLVKACADFFILDTDSSENCRILLGKRKVEPQPDWWFMGGRMRPGEKPEDSVVRLLSRELGVTVEPGAVRFLSVHSYWWYRRVQAPVENGTCDISGVFTVAIGADQAAAIKLDEEEYSDSKWVSIADIIDGEHYHPALRQSARDLKARFAWERLESLVKGGAGTDAEIAEAARNLAASAARAASRAAAFAAATAAAAAAAAASAAAALLFFVRLLCLSPPASSTSFAGLLFFEARLLATNAGHSMS
ncbi:unnamed protein product [Closterium sp. NIES-53]